MQRGLQNPNHDHMSLTPYLQARLTSLVLAEVSILLAKDPVVPLMANTILRSKHHYKAFHAFGFLSFLLVMQRAGATEFKVGGSKRWTVPTDPNALTFNQWAEMHRFQAGDSLLFVYPADKDSVLQVNKQDYDSCNTGTPIILFNDGNTSVKLNQSGPYYFISGNIENCLKNEKMVVVVIANRSKVSTNSTETSSAPPPSDSIDIVPSPAPVGEESPFSSPPPPPPPPPPPSGASSMFTSVIGSIGAFFASSLLVL